MDPDDMHEYLQETSFFNWSHPQVREFISQHDSGTDLRGRLVGFYRAVRDEIRYNPYTFSLDPSTITASHAVSAGQSYCIPKAVLLGSCARAIGVPARIGLADVRNHLSSSQLTKLLQTDYFAMHGYCELHLDGQWIKATPSFNQELCEKLGVEPLDFDGRTDSMFQEYTSDGRQLMEYLRFHGTFADVPMKLIVKVLHETYPHLIEHLESFRDRSLDQDLEES